MIDVPTATADAKTETGLAARLVETAKAFPSEVSIGASVRVSAAGTWTVEHWEADPAPWDGRTVA